MGEKKKGFKVPNAYVIVFTILIIAAIATYIVPAGVYDSVVNEVTGKSVIDPNSFHYIERTPTTFWQFFTVISRGLVKQANVIFFLFLLGGYFQVILDTGAIDAFLGMLVKKFGDKAVMVIPFVMLFMSIMGAVGVLVNPVVAVIPVGLLLAKRLNLDKVAAVGIIFAAAYQGFATSQLCPTTVQFAQGMADLQPLSGFVYRSVVWFIMYLATTWYVMRYAKKLMKDRNASVLGSENSFENVNVQEIDFTSKHAIILIILMLGFAIYTYGALKYTWGTDYMAAIFLIITLLSAAIAKFSPDKMIQSFIKGCNVMTFGCMLIGLAIGVSIILTEGQIVHTIVHAMSLPLAKIPTMFQGAAMYIMNTLFNFFVSSGSSQAAIVMPIMSPLADILGVTRQIAVCAYQYGDGLSNLIFPTNGTLMACLGVAGVGYGKWMKWMIPLFVLWSVIIMISLTVGVMIGVA